MLRLTNVGARLRSARHTIGDRMAAHRKSDQSRADRCAVTLRKRARKSVWEMETARYAKLV